VAKVNHVFEFFVATLMQRESFDEELLSVVTEIVEYRSVAETNCG
jgi:hypothetical protein